MRAVERFQRSVLIGWLVIVPAVLLPARWLPSLDSREFHQWLLVAFVAAILGCVLALEGGPLCWAALLALWATASYAARGFTPPHGIPALTMLVAVGGLVALLACPPEGALVGALAALGTAHLAFAGLQGLGITPHAWVWGGWGFRHPGGIVGLADNANFAALLAAITAPWVLLASRRRAGLCWALGGGAIALLIVSRSFGGVLAAGAALLVWGVSGRGRAARWGSCAGAAAALAGYWRFVDGPGWERWTPIQAGLALPLGSPSSALAGFGLGAFQSLGLGETIGGWRNVWLEAHSEPVQVFFELGAIGLALWLALCASVVFWLWRRRGHLPSRVALASAAAWIAGSLVSFPAHVMVTAGAGLALVLLAQEAFHERPLAPAGPRH